MQDEELQEAPLVCGVRMVTAADGAQIPVPSGEIAGVTDAYGIAAYIPDSAPVQVSQMGSGYYIVMNCAPPANDEAADFAKDLTGKAFEEVLEQALLTVAPKVFKLGLSVVGVLADVLTTSKLTREVFIKADYQGVPMRYCILL